ncbi:MAG: DUF2232 domain-containing protein, partial [Spirochaetota bacterium]
ILSGNWWLGTSIGRRLKGEQAFEITRFSLPDFFIWPLLVSWAGILLDLFKNIGILGYVFWNAGFISLFLFGLQGLGIIRFLFGKHKVARGLRLISGIVLAVFILWPGLNIIVMIGIPGLGVSELWIKYRKS